MAAPATAYKVITAYDNLFSLAAFVAEVESRQYGDNFAYDDYVICATIPVGAPC